MDLNSLDLLQFQKKVNYLYLLFLRFLFYDN
jgi:hypothetical protein